jgi:trehalose synthase
VRITDTSDLWWKSAVFYCLDVETFMDWNDDGVGDFTGLAHRLDYLAELGVTCLWLMPFYPSPGRDDGYDVSDFYGVDPRLGHLGDVVEFIRTARDRGMRVIIDLVVNHTSDKHPWFVSSRASKDSPYRDFYVWRDEPPKKQAPTAFPGEESSVWELDEKTGQYYLHSFYKHQPDLNVSHPAVRDEVAKIMGFWLQLGVSGFRVDAVPSFLDTSGTEGSEDTLDDPQGFLRDLRAFLGRRSGEAILLGEVNLPQKEQIQYFGGDDADALTMQFDFVSMQKMYLALARGDARPLAESLAARPAVAIESQWANFVRNHDELTLDQLSDDEREEVFAAFGEDESMQIYGRGIIRRLPPMLGGDPRRIRMVYSLMFSLPGTPVLFYGEEIGMGEKLEVGDRKAVRTPMQWSAGKNGGFSGARPSRLAAPVVTGGFAPEHVNAGDQRHDPDSLLRFIHLLIERYRASAEIGWGDFAVLEQANSAVLAHSVHGGEGRMIALHNLGPEPTVVDLVLDDVTDSDELVDLLTSGTARCAADGTVSFTLEGYGYRWLRVLSKDSKRLF